VAEGDGKPWGGPNPDGADTVPASLGLTDGDGVGADGDGVSVGVGDCASAKAANKHPLSAKAAMKYFFRIEVKLPRSRYAKLVRESQ